LVSSWNNIGLHSINLLIPEQQFFLRSWEWEYFVAPQLEKI